MSDFIDIKTDRLLIRTLEMKEKEAFFKYRSLPEIYKYQSWRPRCIEEIEEFISKNADVQPNTPGTWLQAAVCLHKGQMIGDIGIHFIDEDQIEIGYTLSPEHQGNGYALEAVKSVMNCVFFNWKKHRVTASVDPQNIQSIKLLEKIGFRKEAHFIKSYHMDNHWYDDCIYAILEEEWQNPDESTILISTERLFLREMEQSDFPALSLILQDEAVMTAYEKTFSDEEVQLWLDKQFARYRDQGFGLWAVILRETGEMIGQCGLTLQDFNGEEVLEIGYLFQKAYWHQGYAIESAAACKNYAFNVLGAEEVYSLIKETNTASRKVAQRNGMTVSGTFSKKYRYYETERHHLAYSVKNPNLVKDDQNNECKQEC